MGDVPLRVRLRVLAEAPHREESPGEAIGVFVSGEDVFPEGFRYQTHDWFLLRSLRRSELGGGATRGGESRDLAPGGVG